MTKKEIVNKKVIVDKNTSFALEKKNELFFIHSTLPIHTHPLPIRTHTHTDDDIF